METQRVYELDRKELKSELQTKEVELKYNARHSFFIDPYCNNKSLFLRTITYGPYLGPN